MVHPFKPPFFKLWFLTAEISDIRERIIWYDVELHIGSLCTIRDIVFNRVVGSLIDKPEEKEKEKENRKQQTDNNCKS